MLASTTTASGDHPLRRFALFEYGFRPFFLAAGMYALVAGFGYLGDEDRADTWFSHGWLHTPLELIEWLDKPRNGSL